MIQLIKKLFTRDEDPNLTLLKSLHISYKVLDEDEQVVVMLRLANKSKEDIAIALSTTFKRVDELELSAIKKLRGA